MAHPNPHTQKLAMAMAREGLLTSTSLAYNAHLSLQAASYRLHCYADRGLVERVGGLGVRHDPSRYKITEAGQAWLDGKPKDASFDFSALLASWRETV